MYIHLVLRADETLQVQERAPEKHVRFRIILMGFPAFILVLLGHVWGKKCNFLPLLEIMEEPCTKPCTDMLSVYLASTCLCVYCKSGNFRGVEIFAHFAAKWSGAKIKLRKYYVKLCVCVCKLVVREIKNTRYSSF